MASFIMKQMMGSQLDKVKGKCILFFALDVISRIDNDALEWKLHVLLLTVLIERRLCQSVTHSAFSSTCNSIRNDRTCSRWMPRADLMMFISEWISSVIELENMKKIAWKWGKEDRLVSSSWQGKRKKTEGKKTKTTTKEKKKNEMRRIYWRTRSFYFTRTINTLRKRMSSKIERKSMFIDLCMHCWWATIDWRNFLSDRIGRRRWGKERCCWWCWCWRRRRSRGKTHPLMFSLHWRIYSTLDITSSSQ